MCLAAAPLVKRIERDHRHERLAAGKLIFLDRGTRRDDLGNNPAFAYGAHVGLGIGIGTLMKAKLGQDHPDTLSSMNNLAIAYRDTGRLSEALPLYEEALRLGKAKLAPDHPNTLMYMNNLANAWDKCSR